MPSTTEIGVVQKHRFIFKNTSSTLSSFAISTQDLFNLIAVAGPTAATYVPLIAGLRFKSIRIYSQNVTTGVVVASRVKFTVGSASNTGNFPSNAVTSNTNASQNSVQQYKPKPGDAAGEWQTIISGNATKGCDFTLDCSTNAVVHVNLIIVMTPGFVGVPQMVTKVPNPVLNTFYYNALDNLTTFALEHEGQQ